MIDATVHQLQLQMLVYLPGLVLCKTSYFDWKFGMADNCYVFLSDHGVCLKEISKRREPFPATYFCGKSCEKVLLMPSSSSL